MMASLRIGLEKRSLDAGYGGVGVAGIEHGIVARLRRVKDETGADVVEPEHEVVVPAGRQTHDVEVSPGLWVIDLLLPSGEVLTQQKRVGDELSDAVLKAGPAPHEWMSWARLEGDVPSARDYASELGAGMKGLTKSPRGVIPGTSLTRRQTRERARTGENATSGGGRTRAGTQERFSRTATATSRLAATITLAEASPTLYAHERFDWSQLVASLQSGRATLQFGAGARFAPATGANKVGQDDWYEAWRLPLAHHDLTRRFAIVSVGEKQELVALPAPWPAVSDEGIVQLTIDVSEASRPFRTSVTMMDMRYGGLLSYLKGRRFALARTIVEQGIGLADFEQILRDKDSNALAAAAATYCLLASSDLNQQRPWFSWVERLSVNYGWVPDGAILHARLLAARGAPASVVKAAYVEAVRRGLPFFSLGVSWLREGLRGFAKDPDLAEWEPLLRQVGLRTDPAQVFTVLRYS